MSPHAFLATTSARADWPRGSSAACGLQATRQSDRATGPVACRLCRLTRFRRHKSELLEWSGVALSLWSRRGRAKTYRASRPLVAALRRRRARQPGLPKTCAGRWRLGSSGMERADCQRALTRGSLRKPPATIEPSEVGGPFSTQKLADLLLMIWAEYQAAWPILGWG